ncbi:MAG: FAD-dependent oxidoreductase [Solirubrobacterales bacterium]|nr:FAD-dependent oxidoreductase [Solirubrobacterales bacterium]
MRVAIIGTGIAGLSAAHLLGRHHRSGSLDLTVFEADSRTGGHANTVEVESERGTERIDTGFIVFNERNYPEFSGLLEELGVASRPSSMSFSVSDGDFEFTGRTARGLFARPRHLVDPRFLGMLLEVPRLQKRLRELSRSGEEGRPLSGFLAEEGFSPELTERIVVPLVASVWSADPARMDEFPTGFLARFLDNHGLLSLRERPRWRTVDGGSRTYVDALTAPIAETIRTDSPVERVIRFGEQVLVKVAGRSPEGFDRVLIATHSDQALRMLAEPTADEAALLGAVPYQANEAVLHTDVTVMPIRRAAWACWNYHLGEQGSGRTALTYDMNRLQDLGCRRRFFVSLNVAHRIHPERMLARFTYEHPVFTPEAVAAQRRWPEVSGADGIHFAGAWLRNGFHEDGAVTGRQAAEQILAAQGQRPVLAEAA